MFLPAARNASIKRSQNKGRAALLRRFFFLLSDEGLELRRG
jgi:hypothetical protein